MTLKNLRELLNRLPLKDEDLEVKVWLPGSRIALHGAPVRQGRVLLIEGNLEEGSTLS